MVFSLASTGLLFKAIKAPGGGRDKVCCYGCYIGLLTSIVQIAQSFDVEHVEQRPDDATQNDQLCNFSLEISTKA